MDRPLKVGDRVTMRNGSVGGTILDMQPAAQPLYLVKWDKPVAHMGKSWESASRLRRHVIAPGRKTL